MLTLNTTIAGEAANSYVDVLFADEYLESHFLTTLADAWANLDDNQKVTALIGACRVIETARFTVQGVGSANSLPTRYVTTQALQFPRNIDVSVALTPYVPEPIKWAQCEQAVYLVSLDTTVLANALKGIWADTLQVGDVRMHQNIRVGGSAYAPLALEYVKPFLVRTSPSIRRG